MPLIISRKNKIRKFKKRHLSALLLAVLFCIALYRAYNIVYHFRKISFKSLKIDSIEILNNPDIPSELENSRSNGFSHLKINVNTLFIESICPLYLEFGDITGEIVSEASDSKIKISMDRLAFIKKGSFAFMAALKLTNFDLKTSVCEFLSSDTTLSLKFYVKARFCFIPLCFYKKLTLKRSDFRAAPKNKLDLDFLTIKSEKEPCPCIKIGIKKSHLSQLTRANPEFAFYVGILKLDFSGILVKRLIINSFHSSCYYETDGILKVPNELSTCYLDSEMPYKHYASTFVPGIVDDKSSDVVFYFMTVQLTRYFENINCDSSMPPSFNLVLNNTSLYTVDELLPESTDFLVQPALEEVLMSNDKNQNVRSMNRREYNQKIVLFKFKEHNGSDLDGAPPNNDPGFFDFSYFIRRYLFSNNVMKFDLAISSNSLLYELLEYIYDLIELKLEFSIKVGDNNVAEAEVGTEKSFFLNRNDFGDVLSFKIKFQENIEFSKVDLENVTLKLQSFTVNEYTEKLDKLLGVIINYNQGITFRSENYKLLIWKFSQKSRLFDNYDIEHDVAESRDKKFIIMKSKVDISEFGTSRRFLSKQKSSLFDYNKFYSKMNAKKIEIEGYMENLIVKENNEANMKNVSRLYSVGTMQMSAKGQSNFVILETPRFSLRIRTPNIRTVTVFPASKFLIFLKSGKKYGKLKAETKGILRKIKVEFNEIFDHFSKNEIFIEINDSIKFKCIPEQFRKKQVSDLSPLVIDFKKVNNQIEKQRAIKNQDPSLLTVFFPFELSFLHQGKDANFLGLRLRHVIRKDADDYTTLASYTGLDFLYNHGFQQSECISIANRARKDRKAIRNIFRTTKLSFPLNFGMMVPLICEADDFEIVMAYNGEDTVFYCNKPADIRINIALPGRKYRNSFDFTADFIKNTHLCCLSDFIAGLAMSIGRKVTIRDYSMENYKNVIDLSIVAGHNKDEKDSLNISLKMPLLTFELPNFFFLNLNDIFSLESDSGDFVSKLEIMRNGDQAQITLNATWNTLFNSHTNRYYLKSQNQHLTASFDTSVMDMLYKLTNLIKFCLENRNVRSVNWEYSYQTNEVKAMGFRDEDAFPEIFYEDYQTNGDFEDTCAKPVIDLEILKVDYSNSKLSGEIKIWSDNLAENVGFFINYILKNLPSRIVENNVTIQLKAENMCSIFYLKDEIRYLGFEKLDFYTEKKATIVLQPSVSLDHVDEHNFENFKKSLNGQMDNFIVVDFEFLYPELPILENLDLANVRTTYFLEPFISNFLDLKAFLQIHSIYTYTLSLVKNKISKSISGIADGISRLASRLLYLGDYAEDLVSDDRIKVSYDREDHIIYLKVKSPFSLNFIGDPLYFTLSCGHVFAPTIKFSGPLICSSYEDFCNGYSIQIPINIPNPVWGIFENIESQKALVSSEFYSKIDKIYKSSLEKDMKEDKIGFQRSVKAFLIHKDGIHVLVDGYCKPKGVLSSLLGGAITSCSDIFNIGQTKIILRKFYTSENLLNDNISSEFYILGTILYHNTVDSLDDMDFYTFISLICNGLIKSWGSFDEISLFINTDKANENSKIRKPCVKGLSKEEWDRIYDTSKTVQLYFCKPKQLSSFKLVK